ncbi:MAG: hypothetical protein UT91_C0013G0023 [Parcubacteria group bacterium GW2011_GWA2_40_23]|nr:MAG: hypothetical protein UT91_C0013G0023 [Parcubacteria group bacterium GW2011_GWA2_40_23]
MIIENRNAAPKSTGRRLLAVYAGLTMMYCFTPEGAKLIGLTSSRHFFRMTMWSSMIWTLQAVSTRMQTLVSSSRSSQRRSLSSTLLRTIVLTFSCHPPFPLRMVHPDRSILKRTWNDSGPLMSLCGTMVFSFISDSSSQLEESSPQGLTPLEQTIIA